MPLDPQLEYARGAVFGPIVLDRRADRTTITLGTSIANRVETIVIAAIGIVCFTPFILHLLLNSNVSRRFFFEFPTISFFAGATLIGSALTMFFASCHARTIEIVPEAAPAIGKFSIAFRRKGEISRFEVPLASIVEAQTKRPVGSRRFSFWTCVVQIILRDGTRVDLHAGTVGECELLTGLLIEECKLPKDSWVEAGFPAPRWFSKLSIRIDPLGLVINQRPHLPWWLIALCLPVLPIATFSVAAGEFNSGYSIERMFQDGELIVGVVIGLISTAGAIALAYNVLRRTSVVMNDHHLVISERSPFRPALVELPIAPIAGFDFAKQGLRHHRVSVRFEDGATVPLIARLSGHDERVLDQCLRMSLLRVRTIITRSPEFDSKDFKSA